MLDRSDSPDPTAVASSDDAGVDAAVAWCRQHMAAGDSLTIWTPQKSNLSACARLEQLVRRHADVDHITGRGGGSAHRRGPLLMAWPDMDNIGKLTRFSGQTLQALCVITWHADAIQPWVSAVQPEILGDGAPWQQRTPELDPVVALALADLTARINHSNTITSGYEKDDVVTVLLALHDAGIGLDGKAIQGWVLAHGWTGSNPQRLATYVADINAGKRPRCRRVLRRDYVADLTLRATQGLEQ